MKEFENIKCETKREFIRRFVYTSAEALEILEISRARLSRMIKDGKLIPVKKSGATSLFLLNDLLEKKRELIKLRKKYGPWE
ncbi:helix-turn-helix domain-containing protein [Priestia megaterium]|uniref:helix-turn-helix domain-containing protein n=1 Tax=Priestia megaterium TaxID=1404 RepID=UPI0034586AF6